MRYLLKLLGVFTLIPFIMSCSNSYNSNEAIKRGDIVDLHGKVSNVERLDIFNSNIQERKKDSIRITRYTTEGDPIFYDFTFDGNNIKYKYDNSNDRFGSNKIRSTTCKDFIKTIEGSIVTYKLDNCSGKNAEMGLNFIFNIKQ